MKLVKETFASTVAGLPMGMLSTQFPSQFFDVKDRYNLWDILSRRTLVRGRIWQAGV